MILSYLDIIELAKFLIEISSPNFFTNPPCSIEASAVLTDLIRAKKLQGTSVGSSVISPPVLLESLDLDQVTAYTLVGFPLDTLFHTIGMGLKSLDLDSSSLDLDFSNHAAEISTDIANSLICAAQYCPTLERLTLPTRELQIIDMQIVVQAFAKSVNHWEHLQHLAIPASCADIITAISVPKIRSLLLDGSESDIYFYPENLFLHIGEKCPDLESITIRNYDGDRVELKALASKCPHLSSITIDENENTDFADWEEGLCEIIAKCPISSLNLYQVHCTARILQTLIFHKRSIQEAVLQITDTDVELSTNLLKVFFSVNTQLHTFSDGGWCTSEEYVNVLIQCVSNHPTLQHLSLSFIEISLNNLTALVKNCIHVNSVNIKIFNIEKIPAEFLALVNKDYQNVTLWSF